MFSYSAHFNTILRASYPIFSYSLYSFRLSCTVHFKIVSIPYFYIFVCRSEKTPEVTINGCATNAVLVQETFVICIYFPPGSQCVIEVSLIALQYANMYACHTVPKTNRNLRIKQNHTRLELIQWYNGTCPTFGHIVIQYQYIWPRNMTLTITTVPTVFTWRFRLFWDSVER